jgi:DNA polymerase III subunit delta
MLYVALDEFMGAEKAVELRAAMGDPSLAELNTTVLDGQRLSIADLKAAAEAMPFLAERRLVIVRRLLARFGSRGGQSDESPRRKIADAQAAFAEYLGQVCPTTDILFIEDGAGEGRSSLLQAAQKAGAKLISPPSAKSGELVDWVRGRVRVKGSKLGPGAAERLVDAIGADLRTLDQEIEKLVLYRRGAEVREDDVALLVSGAREANIFAMIDALGGRNRRQAMAVLHDLIDDGEAGRIVPMIARQWRLLLLAKELRQMGAAQEVIADSLRVAPWQVNKIAAQERNFTWDQLSLLYRALLEVDVATKTGQMEPVVALDLFVAQVCAQ